MRLIRIVAAGAAAFVLVLLLALLSRERNHRAVPEEPSAAGRQPPPTVESGSPQRETSEPLAASAVESRPARSGSVLEVSGSVVGPLGEPVVDAYVRAGGWSTRTDEQGRFSLRVPEAGPVHLVIQHDSYRAAERDADAPAEGLLIALSSGASIEGYARLPSGAPAVGVPVRIWGESQARRVHADQAGYFVISGLDADREYSVGFGLKPASSERVTAPARNVELVYPNHVVRILLRDGADQPVREARLEIRFDGERGYRGPCDGEFVFFGTPGVLFRAQATAAGRVPAWEELPLDPEPRSHEIVLVLPPLR